MPVDRDRLAFPALAVAPRMIGAVLVSEVDGQRVAVRITEVEAYEGADDPASHAFRGRTPRTEAMFGPAGHLYCYFTYGMHWCANVVCGVDDVAAAVLVRGGEIIEGEDVATVRRPAARRAADLARGPARLASALGLAREQNGLDLCDPDSPVRLEHLPARRRRGVVAGPRVGITRAAERPWRFWLDGSPSVSPFTAGVRKTRNPARQTDGRDRRS